MAERLHGWARIAGVPGDWLCSVTHLLLREMSDILVQFDEPQLSADGRMFIAAVRGQRLATGLWAAWIEFQPRIGGEPLRTPRETEQLSRGDLRFWAAGITRTHLADALEEALQCHAWDPPRAAGEFRAPAGPGTRAPARESAALRGDAALLDPVASYRRGGEYVLRQELRSLDAAQLADIIRNFDIAEMDVVDLARTYEDALAERIVAGVQQRVESTRTISREPDVPRVE